MFWSCSKSKFQTRCQRHNEAYLSRMRSNKKPSSKICISNKRGNIRHGNRFKKEFKNFLTKENKKQLYYAGINISYSISSFIEFDSSLKPILSFTESLISDQLDKFETDYDIDWIDEHGNMKQEENPKKIE